MKKTIAVICIMILLISAVCFSGCNTGDSALDGKYRMTEMIDGPLDITADQLDYEVGMTISGNTATVSGLAGANISTDLTVNAGAKTFTWEDGSISHYTLDGNKLTLEGGMTLIFEKQ